MSSIFQNTEELLDDLKTLTPEEKEPPAERLGSPAAARGIYNKLEDDDADGSFNRAIVQGQMDFTPPHDEKELEDKGQSDRFNITTGEGPAIKNEAVAAYMEIYTSPKLLASIPLKSEVDQENAETWSLIMAEEFTIMDRSDDASLPLHLQLADTYVTHGVAVAYFDDAKTMTYSVGGLDHFKFPRKSGIITSKVELCTSLGDYGVTELYNKIGGKGWNKEAIEKAIINRPTKDTDNWDNWEEIQRDIKANEIYVNSICDPIEVVHTWVKEFDQKISYYISAKIPLSDEKGYKEEFLFKSLNEFDSIDHWLQIFAFSVGNGGRLYTVRGLGYLIYQLCNAMDIMHCKLLDNARIGSSLIVQASNVDDLQDMQLTDFGGGVALSPGMQLAERQYSQNLSNSLVPAINESRNILNRATGGLASSNQMLNDNSDRQTKLEVSSKLDFINKLNSFAINLFYGPYDKIMREKVRRAFNVRQPDKDTADRVKEMKKRCIDRGVPKEVFALIDFKGVKSSRIIGTGSRASRILLMDQMKEMYSTWDAVGRANFEYDYLVELVGAEKAEHYAGKATEKRMPVDFKIATLENFQLLEGDYMDPTEGENNMVHLGVHIEALEAGLQGVDEGQVDLMEWTMEHQMLYQHCVATLEITTVHETVQPELNTYHQRVQQIGEIVVNGMKMINKAKRDGDMAAEGEEQELTEEDARQSKVAQDMKENEARHQQKMQQDFQTHLQRLAMIKQSGEQEQVMTSQKAMSNIVEKDAANQLRLERMRSQNI